MKILFTGGGTGGHFYPIIAIAEELNTLVYEKKLLGIKMYFMSDAPYNANLLRDHKIIFLKARSGKWRRYFSIQNFFDIFNLAYGVLEATWKIFWLYPDVIFSKGGYASMPAVLAGRVLGIPIIIHESDAHPGRANLYASRFAYRIAVSYPEAVKYFDEKKTAVTGNPLRSSILNPLPDGAKEFLQLTEDKPVILVLGGSLGAKKINDTLLSALPELLDKYQIIHQIGNNNFTTVTKQVKTILENNPHLSRYKPFAYLNDLAMRMSAGMASLVISRAGSAIFEIANWQLPSIIVPIPESVSHDQSINAFTYGRSGAGVVIEENNFSPSVLISEVDRILSNPALIQEMKTAAKNFSNPQAGRVIAEEILTIALQHER